MYEIFMRIKVRPPVRPSVLPTMMLFLRGSSQLRSRLLLTLIHQRLFPVYPLFSAFFTRYRVCISVATQVFILR